MHISAINSQLVNQVIAQINEDQAQIDKANDQLKEAEQSENS